MTKGTGNARTITRAIPLISFNIAATGIASITAAYGTGVLGEILNVGQFAQIISVIALINVVVFAIGHLYNSLWEYVSVDELMRIVIVVTTASIISDTILALIFGHRVLFRVYGVAWLGMLVVCGASRFAIRMYSGRKGWSIMSVTESDGVPRSLIVKDTAESLGATYKGRQTGTFGDYNCISFNGNKIITGSSGGMLLTDSAEAAGKVRKWSTQAREAAPWYQHEKLGYNYRIDNVIAGVVYSQIPYLDEHIAQKKAIYERYKEGFKDLPVTMNPYDDENNESNYWLSCLLVDEEAMCAQVRGERDCLHVSEHGRSCPHEILEALFAINAEGRPIWKPMHVQPNYRNNLFVTRDGDGRARTNDYIDGKALDVGMDIFQRGVCLPSDNKMTIEQQEVVIEAIKGCFE